MSTRKNRPSKKIAVSALVDLLTPAPIAPHMIADTDASFAATAAADAILQSIAESAAPSDAAPLNPATFETPAPDAAVNPFDGAPILPADNVPTAAPATTDVPADATPVIPSRARVGVCTPLPAGIHVMLVFNGAVLNGAPESVGHAVTLSPVALTADDAPALVLRAAILLASVGSSLAVPETVPFDAFDALATHYLSHRETDTRPSPGYFERNHVSDLDRIAYATRAAQRLVRARDMLLNPAAKRRQYCGGFNGRVATEMRRDSVASVVSALF